MKISITNKIQVTNQLRTKSKAIKINNRRALKETANFLKEQIKKEMRLRKTGELKTRTRRLRYPASPVRRSASGESAARDTGLAEKSINVTTFTNTSNIGFKGKANKYMSILELDKNRPTLSNVEKKSLKRILTIFRKHTKV